MYSELVAAIGRQHGVFTAAQARAAGFDRDEIHRLVRRGHWRPVRRGVYVLQQRWEEETATERGLHLLRCAALALVLGRPLVLSHWSAARLHRLPWAPPAPDLLTGTDPDTWRQGRDYRIHAAQLPADHVVQRHGWSATSVARTVIDLARGIAFADAVVLADGALSLSLTTPAELTAAVLACTHWNGIGNAARVCMFADGGAQSVLESLTRVDLMAAGVPRPQLQVRIADADGFIGQVDMLWEDYGIVGEVDGKVKYTEPYPERPRDDVLWREKLRQGGLENTNLRVIRFLDRERRRSPAAMAERWWALARRPREPATYRILPADHRTSVRS